MATDPTSTAADAAGRVLDEIRALVTEQRNPRTRDIDLADAAGILQLINDEDRTVAEVVRAQIPSIAQAVACTERSLRAGGRIVYIGAGTSGRLGVLDAAECPPTFGTDPSQVVGVLAGGLETLVRAREGVEDREDAAEADLRAIHLEKRDTLIAITASRRTPYAVAGLRYARSLSAATVFVTCNTPAADLQADVIIAVVVGPEVVTGSTRMKSGTAQKLVLNMISTATMIRIGKVYENLMVDLRPLSKKLEARSRGILMSLLDLDTMTAAALLDQAGGSVKRALFMGLAHCDAAEAERRLDAAGGVLRRALETDGRWSRRWVAAACGLLLATTAASRTFGSEPPATDLARLNARIGTTFETAVTDSELIDLARAHRVVLLGEAHDQPEGVAHFLELAEALAADKARPLQLGIEFVDRGDWDILARYLQGGLPEQAFLDRLWPTSLLLWPGFGAAHLEVLRFARKHHLAVLPLESRPAGARPLVLRNAEIRWNLSMHLGQHARERLLVLYGVQHVFGEDAISDGIEVPMLEVSAYGDSVLEDHARRMGSYPVAGAVLRLRPSVYLIASGGPPRSPGVLDLELGAREPLLSAIERAYVGDWSGLDLVVAALADPEIRWRRAAFHALRHATQHTYEYDPETSPTVPTTSRQRWNSWWSRTRRQLPSAP